MAVSLENLEGLTFAIIRQAGRDGRASTVQSRDRDNAGSSRENVFSV